MNSEFIKIFIDADAFIAFNNLSDALHKKAVDTLKQLSKGKFRYYTSLNVLMEAVTIVNQKVGKKQAVLLLRELRSGNYAIINPSQREVLLTEDLFKSIKSKNVSYSDCLSFIFMKANNIDWVFSFDIHFKKQGFKRLSLDGFPGKA